MMIRPYAARSAKGRLEPFEYDPGPIGPHQVDGPRDESSSIPLRMGDFFLLGSDFFMRFSQ